MYTDQITSWFVFTEHMSGNRFRLVFASVWRKKGKRKDHWMIQSQGAALHRHQEEEETHKTKQAQIEQTYGKD